MSTKDIFTARCTDPVEAHKFSFRNREALSSDMECGCFYCMKIFPPDEIGDWLDDDQTAVCPYCGIDSVIGESSGYPLTEEDLLKMHLEWFGGTGLNK